jgi:predicted metal-dependent hydrolase
MENSVIVLNGDNIPFSVRRSRRRKRTIAFRLDAYGTVQVIAPVRSSPGTIHNVLQKHAAWVTNRLAEYRSANDAREDGQNVFYLGHACRMQVARNMAAPHSCALRRRRFEVNVPDAALSPQGLMDEARLETQLWLKRRAREKFRQRVEIWARKLNVRFGRVIIADADRRWGSCNARNDIRLNWRLIMAPLPLLDYVVAHELCHVVHKNHSRRFWQLLKSVMPDYEMRNKRLRQTGPGLML